MKTVVIILLILLGYAIYKDPSIIKPWQRAAVGASQVIGDGIKTAGELTAESVGK